MKLFNKIILKIDNYFSANENKIIKELKKDIVTANKELILNAAEIMEQDAIIEDHEETIEESEQIIKELESELTETSLEESKHSSLNNYKTWLEENTRKIVKKYNYDGSGKKDVTTIFSKSLKHEDLIRDFTSNDMGFDGSKYKTANKLIYYFNKEFSKKFPTKKYYIHDIDNWGRREYWAMVDKIIAKFRKKKGKADDCEGIMTLKYCMLYYLLKDYFPDSIWRLRGFIVNIWTGGCHALLAWVKEGVNDWVPVETTFYDTRNQKIWNENYTIRSQMLYQIKYSFDDKYSYVKI